jgi:hypothetical protein
MVKSYGSVRIRNRIVYQDRYLLRVIPVDLYKKKLFGSIQYRYRYWYRYFFLSVNCNGFHLITDCGSGMFFDSRIFSSQFGSGISGPGSYVLCKKGGSKSNLTGTLFWRLTVSGVPVSFKNSPVSYKYQ